MKKIAVGAVINETCSFNVVKITLRDFEECYFKRGAEVAGVLPNERAVGGFIAAMKAARPDGFRFEGTLAVNAIPGGELASGTFARLKDILLSEMRKAGPLDGVFLNLMGAMVAEGEADTTGVILSEVRRLVGPDCPIVVSLDHHGNVTKRMVAEADVIVGYETQPHDFPSSGAKAARVMLELWKRGRTPHAALVKVPLLTPQDHFLTAAGPMKEWFDLAREIEGEPGVLVATTCPTQPWLDVPDNGWSCLVYADTAEKARECSERLAQKAWDLREGFWRSERLSVPDTIAAANAEPRGLVVISDTGDSTWGGAPGDSTALLSEMLKQGVNGPALLPMVDPEAMERALLGGKGRRLTLRLGGRMSAAYTPSVEATGVVGAFAEAGERDFGDGIVSKSGRTALFECGNLKIALQELRDVPVNHPVLYEKLGVDVAKAKMVVLKTASNFQYFRKYQSRLIRADSPGATQSDLTAFKWKHITHPIYPFDDIRDWRV